MRSIMDQAAERAGRLEARWSARISEFSIAPRWWLLRDVLLVFVISRILLYLVAYLAQYFRAGDFLAAFSDYPALNIWARWDSGWYMQIVNGSYWRDSTKDWTTSMTSFAFFPLYPLLVKALAVPLAAVWHSAAASLLAGLVVSNAALIGALVILYRLTCMEARADDARRAVLYMLFFPMGFFFSAFYTESLYLLLSLAAFYSGRRGRWVVAGIAGGLSALTRPTGVLILVPLFLMYAGERQWKVRKFDRQVLALVLIPTLAAVYPLFLYSLVGNPLAFVSAQSAWGHATTWPWQTLLYPLHRTAIVTPFELSVVVVFLVLNVLTFIRLPLPYGVFTLLNLLPPLISGDVNSMTRYCAITFPSYMMLARLGRNRILDNIIIVFSVGLQVLWMIAWVRFYWVV